MTARFHTYFFSYPAIRDFFGKNCIPPRVHDSIAAIAMLYTMHTIVEGDSRIRNWVTLGVIAEWNTPCDSALARQEQLTVSAIENDNCIRIPCIKRCQLPILAY